MSNGTDSFGDIDPFCDENADQHQWEPEPSEDTLESSLEDFDTSGQYTNQPENINSLVDEEVPWDSQGATDDDPGAEAFLETTAQILDDSSQATTEIVRNLR
jgi:hypothetical protein